MASSTQTPPLTATKPSPSSSDSDSSTVVIVVFVSIGSLCVLAFLLVALCCFVRKMKKTKKAAAQEVEILDRDEHLKIKEAVAEGPHGGKAVTLSIEDDVHVEEKIKKNESIFEESSTGSDAPHFHHKDKHLISNEV